MAFAHDWKEVFTTEAKFLCGRSVRLDRARLGYHYLTLALVASWLAGVGRYWDHPEPEWWQVSGLGSVAYVIFFSFFLWFFILPMSPKNWSYLGVLTFVGMTSPPAFFYAIPVERFVELETARSINYWFLLVVALWRVALLWLYLRRAATFSRLETTVAVLLPLAIIMIFLGLQQLSHLAMQGMAGVRDESQPGLDLAGRTVLFLGQAAFFSFPVLVIAYITIISRREKAARDVQADVPPRNFVQPPPVPPQSDQA